MKRFGFTLIEVLVVVTIIGVLTAIGIISYTSMQRKGRDARRIQDVKSITDGLDQYYTDHNGSFPTDYATELTSVYLPAGIPKDPKPNDADPNKPNYSITVAQTSYCVCAMLENLNGNSSDVTCSSFVEAQSGSYYCVKNRL